MKVLKPIEVIARYNEYGIIRPLRFRIALDDASLKVIKVDKILTTTKEKLDSNDGIFYKCQSLIDGKLAYYELKFELSSCKWKLCRM